MTLKRADCEVEGVRLLRAHGEFDITSAPRLHADVPAMVADTAALVLDVSTVDFFDSAGVRLVDLLARECDRTGVAFQVIAPTGTRGRRVLDLVGMSGALVCDDLAAALERVRPG
jgi:anti-sigma B factor antagonist